jgi:uncharacterized membrane protein
MVMAIVSFIFLLIRNKNQKAIITTTITFSIITFILLLSDKVGEFAADILGNKLSARFDEIKSSQDNFQRTSLNESQKVLAEQKKLSAVTEKILEIIEFKDLKKKPLVFYDANDIVDSKRYDDSIKVNKDELKNFLKK